MASTTTILQKNGQSSFLRNSKVTESRPFDYAYDKNYHLSAQVDYENNAFVAKSGTSNLHLQPIYRTMFSELRHHPRFTFQMRPGHVLPANVNQEWSGKNNYQREKMIVQKIMTGDESIRIPGKPVEACDVDGQDRYKFARRPLIPFLNTIPPYVVLDNYVSQELAALESTRIPHTHRPSFNTGIRTIATQTDYRDGEAQTDPYTPEYVVKPGTQPELLTLITLAYGRGLPVGLAEVEMIERARAKRAWEAQLPPLNDPTQWDKRLRMMTEMERNEWAFREKEIKEIQDIRMDLLKKMLKQREENQAAILTKKLDRLWMKKQREKESKIRKLRVENIKNIRKLIKSREKMKDQIEQKQKNIIEEYSKYESEAYAPLTRHGYFPDKNADNYVVHNKYLDSYQGLLELEASLPSYVLKLQIQPPQRIATTRDGYLKRKYREEKRLDNIYGNIMSAKEEKNREEKPLRFLKEVERPAPRPPTPQIEVPDLDQEELDMAVIYLQRIIRGKAIQNMMHQGKEDNLVLIKECSSTHALQKADEAKTREHKDRVLALQRERQLNERAQALSDEVLQSLEGEACADMLDFLSKELVRLQEERRIHAFAMLAERERRMREAEESGWRQVEERRRREEDEIFKQMLKVEQDTVETYLQDCILDATEAVADQESRKEIQEMATKINDIAYELEKNRTKLESEYIVAELVHGFLIPETEKQVYRHQIKQKQEPYLIAAHKEIYNETNKVLNEQNTTRSTN